MVLSDVHRNNEEVMQYANVDVDVDVDVVDAFICCDAMSAQARIENLLQVCGDDHVVWQWLCDFRAKHKHTWHMRPHHICTGLVRCGV